MDTHNNLNYTNTTKTTTTLSFTNGENPPIIEGNTNTSVIQEALNGVSNGFTKEINGDGIVEYPLPESNKEDEETETIIYNFSKSPENVVGLKYVESLLDESSNGVNGAMSEIYNGDNIVNKTLIVNGQSEIVELGGSREVEKEKEDEYDVESVIHKQETHDLICPHCHRDITKRVILKRKKRKIEQISGGVDDIRVKPGPIVPDVHGKDLDVDERRAGIESSQVEGYRDDRIDAISCFSCFSIFVPKGDGFLWWRFKPKSAFTSQTDDPSVVSIDQAELANDDKTVPKFDSKPSLTSETDSQELSKTKSSITPNIEPELPPSTVPFEETLLPPTPENPVPVKLTPDEGRDHPLWILMCCQPSEERTKTEHAPKPGTTIQHHDKELFSTQSSDMPSPPISEPSIISERRETILPKPLPPLKRDNDVSSRPEPEAPPTPPKGEVSVVPALQEQPMPQTSNTPNDTSEMGLRRDIEQPLLTNSREPARTGISGLEIIKAIVYGGLLECITSLGVITSAIGGEATTLNIVALGLANVCAGLVILLHNLRILKHEHTTEQYTQQLGRPNQYLLHAIVAIVSYLTFGLMPPIIYGFTFRKSNDKDYKLATLGAASLLCIAILSIGKSYVRRPPKAYFQTVFYYISLGFLVSGVGYVVGNLINMLLKKLGLFDSRPAPDTLNGAWASY